MLILKCPFINIGYIHACSPVSHIDVELIDLLEESGI